LASTNPFSGPGVINETAPCRRKQGTAQGKEENLGGVAILRIDNAFVKNKQKKFGGGGGGHHDADGGFNLG
jgi:hypothetical protein